MKVVDYKLVFVGSWTDFERQVKDSIAAGWQPQGGACVFFNDSGLVSYTQAMVKYEEPK